MLIRGEQRATVPLGADALWALVADVTRAPEWSPDCQRCEWVGSATGPVLGARFTGFNRMPFVGVWRSHCTVTACAPGRDFAFAVGGPDADHPNSVWEYRLHPRGADETEVVEAYRVLREPWVVGVYYRLTRRDRHLARTVTESLLRLAAVAARESERNRPSTG